MDFDDSGHGGTLLAAWAAHFEAQGADSFTAQRQAVAHLYQQVTRQAQLLAFADDFWLLFLLFCGTLLLLPLLERIRLHAEPAGGARQRARDAPAPVHAD